MLPIENEIAFGLGHALQYAFNDALDITLPSEVVDQLNNKAHVNNMDEFVFDHEGYSGRLGMLDGEMEWNDGRNTATYQNIIEEDGLTGAHIWTMRGDHEEIAREFFEIENWATYDFYGILSWDIDPMNLKATFQDLETITGTSPQGNDIRFVYDTKLIVEAEANEESLNIVFTPSRKSTGIDDAQLNVPEMISHLPEGISDIDYTGTVALQIPSVSDCENYFSDDSDFNKDSQCQINIESSDLPMSIVLKTKHKFAFIRAGEFMAYVRSENRNGKMVGFDQKMYLSFYVDENVQGRSFNAIKEKSDLDLETALILTIPLENAFHTQIIPAVFRYAKKWEKFGENLVADAPKSIIKAVYWVNKWVPSVEDSTFDFSDIAAATRFGGFAGELTNQDIQDTLKAFAEDIAWVMQNHEFELVVAMQASVRDIVRAEKEATRKFALPA